MEVWHENDNEKKYPGWVAVFLALLAISVLGLIILGLVAVLSPLIPG